MSIVVPLAVLATGCAYFQPKFQRAWQVDQLLISERMDEALNLMQQFDEYQFPANWDPPPRFPIRRVPRPDIVELARAIERRDAPTWIADRLMVQSDEIMMRQHDWFQGTEDLGYIEQMLSVMDP